MKSIIKKIAKPLAIGIFFMALFFNVKLSLTDPFINLDNAALAQSSSSIYDACPGNDIALHYQYELGYSLGMSPIGVPIYTRRFECREGGWCCPMQYA